MLKGSAVFYNTFDKINNFNLVLNNLNFLTQFFFPKKIISITIKLLILLV